jgi:hypothetical protein
VKNLLSGHGIIFEWSDYSTADLKKILKHSKALEKLGVDQDEDLQYSIVQEIQERESNDDC